MESDDSDHSFFWKVFMQTTTCRLYISCDFGSVHVIQGGATVVQWYNTCTGTTQNPNFCS